MTRDGHVDAPARASAADTGEAAAVAVSGSHPQVGDVMVSADPGVPGRFTVFQVPHAPQVSWDSYEEALEIAGGFARRHGLDLWSLAGETPTRVAHFRGTTPPLLPVTRPRCRTAVRGTRRP